MRVSLGEPSPTIADYRAVISAVAAALGANKHDSLGMTKREILWKIRRLQSSQQRHRAILKEVIDRLDDAIETEKRREVTSA